MKTHKSIGLLFMCVALPLIIVAVICLRLSDSVSAGLYPVEKTGIFTAYTADMAQTDSSPTITASNQQVQEGIVANNCLPFGTKIKANGRIYEVQDRMNNRYGCENFDIYMTDISAAIDFGKQPLTYELL
jgi:3D (Asp-Asp-Asp) domain-containing protein